MTLSKTPEQEAFISTLLEKRPCFLSARAGTGKTTTIRLGFEALKASGVSSSSLCAVAFNKANQTDLAQALGLGIKVSTLHSLGYAALRSFLPSLSLADSKIFSLLASAGIKGKNRKDCFRDTLRLVSAAKNWGLVPKDPKNPLLKQSLVEDSSDTWLELQNYFELWDADLSLARKILIESNRQAIKEKSIDFDDMVYLPVALGLKIFGADYMIVDEAQDLSPLNLAMLKSSPSKIWYVGDPYQTIYSWRGASAEVVRSLGLPVLPLTNCWRCSGSIISYAKKLVPDIRTDNPAGSPVLIEQERIDWSKMPPATILARRNADLVSLALEFKEKNLRACIFGRDFVATLSLILDKLKGTTSQQLKVALKSWAAKMSEDYPHREAEIKDYARCLDLILSEVSGAQAAKKLLEKLFTDLPEEGAWLLSTVHRAKGKEWPEVWVLDWGTEGINQPWQAKEDRNLRYVAATRAKSILHIAKESSWKREEGKIDFEASLKQTQGLVPKEFWTNEEETGLWD